jgi:anaerobic magnesium-protoporphyrin IX monomethyl ester cyclase
MRVALLYPPPWKIPPSTRSQGEGASGELPDQASGDGPPTDYRAGDLDADFYQTPYGLFALGAQALRAGHEVKILNLSAFPWSTVEDVVRKLDADVYGMSCWTANRRGVALVARSLRAHHPRAHIVIGGPHATPLATELLSRWPEVDTVCLGESDVTFLELLDRLASGQPATGLAGTAYRVAGGAVQIGPQRKSVEDLDSLACPHDYFDTHIVMTSRGCPWACTFCGAETTWGRGFRGNSVGYVLDALEKLVARLPVKMVQIKDDTFTTNKARVMQLCEGIRERKLRFLWSCDTRVDLLTEPLLREMRLAGCQRLSLGVESGSQRILDAIDKKITVDEIVRSTELAKKVGLRVRYFMMLGNRGETAETFRETLAFLERARPHEYIFSCLSVYPGTRDFHDAEAAGWLTREAYFRGDFQELKMPYDATEDDAALMNAWFRENSGLQVLHRAGAAECRAILEGLPDHAPAHMDLADAYYREGSLASAEQHVRRAMDLGYPLPGIALNYLACIAKDRGDLDAMMDLFSRAAKEDPQHYLLIQNVQAARAWFKKGGPASGLPLALKAHHDFQLLERTVQPTLPGPLPEDFAVWGGAGQAKPLLASTDYVRTPDVEGSRSVLGDRRRLKVIPEQS